MVTDNIEMILTERTDSEKIIIDTDIGTDIDDAFAVALALRSPELHVLGVTTASGDTLARARILDRMLGECGNDHVPVGIGRVTALHRGMPAIGRQGRYGEGGNFARATHPSAVEFTLEQISRHPGEITLITLGPLTNIGDLIDRDYATFRRLKRIVMMGGAIGPITLGSAGTTSSPIPEHNVVNDITSAQKLFNSEVPIYAITLNATIDLRLDEVKRDIIFSQSTPLTDSLTLLYHLWGCETPILYDPVAVGFVIDSKLCPVKRVRIHVGDDGITRVERGPPNVAICMRLGADAFLRFLLRRLGTPAGPMGRRDRRGVPADTVDARAIGSTRNARSPRV